MDWVSPSLLTIGQCFPRSVSPPPPYHIQERQRREREGGGGGGWEGGREGNPLTERVTFVSRVKISFVVTAVLSSFLPAH